MQRLEQIFRFLLDLRFSFFHPLLSGENIFFSSTMFVRGGKKNSFLNEESIQIRIFRSNFEEEEDVKKKKEKRTISFHERSSNRFFSTREREIIRNLFRDSTVPCVNLFDVNEP